MGDEARIGIHKVGQMVGFAARITKAPVCFFKHAVDKASEGICLDLSVIFSRTDLKLALEHVLESAFPEALNGRNARINSFPGGTVIFPYCKKPAHYILRDRILLKIVSELNCFTRDRILESVYDVVITCKSFQVFENTALRLAVFMDHVNNVGILSLETADFSFSNIS